MCRWNCKEKNKFDSWIILIWWGFRQWRLSWIRPRKSFIWRISLFWDGSRTLGLRLASSGVLSGLTEKNLLWVTTPIPRVSDIKTVSNALWLLLRRLWAISKVTKLQISQWLRWSAFTALKFVKSRHEVHTVAPVRWIHCALHSVNNKLPNLCFQITVFIAN